MNEPGLEQSVDGELLLQAQTEVRHLKKTIGALRDEMESTADWENWYRHVGMEWDNVLIVSAPASINSRVIGGSVADAAEVLAPIHGPSVRSRA